MELKWWETNLHLMKGKPIHIAPPQMIISSDAAKTGGWGAASQGISPGGGGDLDAGREPAAHQHSGANSSRTGNQNFYKRERGLFDSHSDGQHSSLMLFNKNGGNEKSGTEHNIETNMAVPAREGDNTHCGVDTNTPKCDSRQGIAECKRFQRMETKYQHFSSLGTVMGEPRNRPICLQDFTPTATICKPKTRSTMYPRGCISKELGKTISLCFPPILPYTENFKESMQRTSQGNDLDHTTVVNPNMVPLSPNHVNKKPCFNTNEHSNINGSTRGEPPIYIELHNEIGGLDVLKRSLSNEGISREATQLIACARREGTRYNHEAARRKWAVWCGEREMDPLNAL